MKVSVFFLLFWQYSRASGVTIDECCRKPNMHTLDCSGCRLEQVPHLSDPEIIELRLNDNNIRSLPDYVFANLTSLESLNLRDNFINPVSHHSFVGLGRLRNLDLTQNDPYTIAELSFKPLLSLTTLKLGWICPRGDCNAFYPPLQYLPQTLQFLELAVQNIDITRFPSLPNLGSLILYGYNCILPEIRQETFEAFSGSLHTLEIHDCGVRNIDTRFLRNFRKLKTLNFACNNYADLNQVFESVKQMPASTLTTLIADGVQKSDFIAFNTDWVDSVRFRNIQRLSLRDTNIVQFYGDVFFHLPSLTHINLGFNSIISTKLNTSQTHFLSFLHQLKITAIDVSNLGQSVSVSGSFRSKFCRDNYKYSDDFFRRHPRHVVIPDPLPKYNHTVIVDESDRLEHNLVKNFPPSILFLYGPSVSSGKTKIDKGSITPDNNILYMDYSNTPVLYIGTQLHGFNQLQGIDMSGCGIHHISPEWANYLPSLIFLNLSRNELSNSMYSSIFSNAPLRTLDLSSNRISFLSETIFESIESLQTLLLHSNPLGVLDINLRKNINLSFLDLSNTTLTVTERLMEDLEFLYKRRKESLQVKMLNNIFQCDCSTLNFLQWLKNTKVNLLGRSSFRCYDNKQKITLISEIDVDALNFTCNKMRIVTIVVTPLASGILVLLLLTLTHRYRWRLKWHFYLLRRSVRYCRKNHSEGNMMLLRDMQYTAFFSYNHTDDYEWVCDSLLSKVEDEWGFSICIGQRDFVAGVPIAENICRAIDNSHYTILVITPGFVSSEWCEFEMHMALIKGMSHIIIIYREEVDVEQMSRTLRGLISSVNYIEYSDTPNGNELFWKRLKEALSKERI